MPSLSTREDVEAVTIAQDKKGILMEHQAAEPT
jgi:hypothetical protein